MNKRKTGSAMSETATSATGKILSKTARRKWLRTTFVHVHLDRVFRLSELMRMAGDLDSPVTSQKLTKVLREKILAQYFLLGTSGEPDRRGLPPLLGQSEEILPGDGIECNKFE